MELLFDLDGTLTDPGEGIIRCIQYALEKLGGEVPPAVELHSCVGPPLSESFARLLSKDNEIIDKAIDFYRERYSTTGIFENALYPGIPRALGELRAQGWRLYIATSKPYVFARRVAEHFEIATAFHEIYGPELHDTRSGKIELIRCLLEQEQLDPTGVWMVGDRAHDIVGARANGVGPIGVLWGYGSQSELEESGSEIIVSNVEELVEQTGLLSGGGSGTVWKP
jgi:phosphoglycolate phosphatase